MDPQVAQLAEVFGRSIQPDRDVIRQAEEHLKAVSAQPGYAIAVLQVIAAADAVGVDVRLAAAVNFKNTVKYRWAPTEQALDAGTQAITDPEKGQIKQLLTGLMLSTPPLVRAQLSEALTLISGHDFPAAWSQLLPELKERLAGANGDVAVINGVLQTANSIFKRYRDQYRSNALVSELAATQVRPEDEEVFEMNPIEYIRRDSEGGDSDTRRRAAADLVRALTDTFEAQVTELFTGYVGALLQENASNPQEGWRAKDCAVYLVMAVTVKGRTGERGATTTNRLVNVGDFFTQQVLPELQDPKVDSRPILKADALKFVTVFRSQLPPQTLLSLLQPCTALLGSESVVVHSYAATAIERFLALKEAGQIKLSVAEVLPLAQGILQGLFNAFQQPDSAENEYLMRAVMRLISFLGPQIAPVAPMCLQALANMLVEVCKNPKSPGFNHYLFESVAALIKHGTAGQPQQRSTYEGTLFPAFNIVLQNDVQEFHPYVFQILAQLIELHTDTPLSPSYMMIFPPLLNPMFWERPGNIPALTRLLVAYLSKAGQQIVAGGHLTAMLGVFQKLIASKANDAYGFMLLRGIVESLPLAAYQQYMPTVWQLLFTRLQGSKTPKFTRGFVLFLAFAICKLGAQAVSSSMDAVQPKIMLMILQQVWVPNLSLAGPDPDEEKLVTVAATKCLTESGDVYGTRPLWEQLRAALDEKLKGAGSARSSEDDGQEDIIDAADAPGGYSAAYAKLANASVPERPVLAEIADPKQFAESSLASFISRMGSS